MVKQTTRHPGEWANPRTVVVLTLLLLGTLWSALIVSAIAGRQAGIATTTDVLQRMSHAVEEQTRQQFRLIDTFLASCEHWLREYPGRDPRRDPAFRKLVEGFLARTGESVDIQLLAADGQVVDLLSPARIPLAKMADRDFFKGALASGSLFVGKPTRNPLNGHPGLPIALPLQNPAQGIQILLAVIDLPMLTRSYDEQRQKPGGAITLLGRDGTVLARAPHDEQLLGQPLASARQFSEQPTGQRQSVVVPAGQSGAQREFISYSSMRDFPLAVMVSQDYDEALSPWQRQTVWLVLLALGVTVPLAVVAYRSLRLLRVLANRDAQLQYLATSDRLTGASSRQHFVETLKHELVRAHRYHSPLSVLLFDIDFFKRINDGYGHAFGDQALVAFADAAQRGLREMDLLGRLGGSEFSILLPNTELREAVLVAERVRSEVARISIPTENGTVQFTISVGASVASATDRSVDDLLKRAAEALHAARAGGHDQVAVI